MRVNVYSGELTNEVQFVQKASDTGQVYAAVRFILHSSERLHFRPGDDDRSAVTFWLPASQERREEFARALEEAASGIRGAAPEFQEDLSSNERDLFSEGIPTG